MPSPCTEPSPPRPLNQALSGRASSHASTSHAWASATRAPGALPLRASAICWPSVFMNSEALATLVVPKSAYGWPLIGIRAPADLASVLSPASALITVAKSPVALAKVWSSA